MCLLYKGTVWGRVCRWGFGGKGEWVIVGGGGGERVIVGGGGTKCGR